MKSLYEYKLLDLTKFMLTFDYIKLHKSSSNSSPKLTNEMDGDIYIIKKGKKNIQTYFSPINEPNINGKLGGRTIIDFALNHNQKIKGINRPSFKSAVITIEEHLPLMDSVGMHFKPSASSSQNTSYLKLYIKDFDKKDLYYFNKRKIKESIVEDYLFNDSIKTYNNHYTKENVLCYLMYGEKTEENPSGLCAVNRKYYIGKKKTESKFLGSRSKGFVISKTTLNKPLEDLFVFESLEDEMAYIQLFGLTTSSSKYISSEGGVTNEQIVLLSKFRKSKHFKTYHLCQDNDIPGYVYRIKIIIYLLDSQFSLLATNLETETIRLKFNQEILNYLSSHPIGIKTEEISTSNLVIKGAQNIKEMCNILAEYYNSLPEHTTNIINHFPIKKDFNDDL